MTFQTRTVSVSINRKASEVYAYLSDPRHFTQWAPGFALSMEATEQPNTWNVETAIGKAMVQFVGRNDFGILDHYVQLPAVPEIYSPMRVLVNNEGAEVIFTVFRLADMTAEQFAADAKTVQGDLDHLKALLEH